MVDWDQRYSRKTYVYGEAPSPVVDEAVAAGWLPPPPCRVLLLGEGEGRNAVALAARGYACVALDPSAAGLAKCAALAKKRGVDVDRVGSAAGVALARGGLGLFDAVVSVYCAYASGDERREAHALVARCLWPGGVYVYVGFGEKHEAVVAAAAARGERRVAGCGGDRAAGPATVARELAGFETVAARERAEVLAEGAFHRGAASVAVGAGKECFTFAST
jgi:SAM-dependent methyltransferase